MSLWKVNILAPFRPDFRRPVAIPQHHQGAVAGPSLSKSKKNKLVASFVYEGTQLGPYYGTGRTHKRLWFTCGIFRLADGQIVEH
jgi:hypothetical protein